MTTYKPSQAFSVDFTTRNPATSAAIDADGGSTSGTAYKNGTLDAGFPITVTHQGVTGLYKATGTVPAGYVAGDTFTVVVTAAVATVTDRATFGPYAVDTKRVSELNDAAAAPTAAAVRAEMDANSTKLAVLPTVATDVSLTKSAAQSVDGKLTLARSGYLDKLNVAGILAQQGDAMALTGGTRVQLATTQPDYAPAKAGDAMTLTAGFRVKLDAAQPDYAPSKAGDAMALVANQDVRNITGTAAFYTAPDNASIAGIKNKTDNLPASPAADGGAMTLTAGTRVQLAAIQSDYAPAKAGDAMTITSPAVAALVAAIEAELANDATGGALMQAISDKLAADFDIEDVTISAIATAVRDAVLDRVLAGNHDTTGTLGKLAQSLPSSGTIPTTAPDNAGIAAIKLKTDTIPLNPASVGSAMTLAPDQDVRNITGTAAFYTAPDNAGVANIKARTDLIPNNPASVGSAMTLAANQDVRNVTGTVNGMVTPDNSNIVLIKNKVDTLVNPDNSSIASIKAKTDTLVPPDNAGIAAIKERTDRLPDSPAESGDTALLDVVLEGSLTVRAALILASEAGVSANPWAETDLNQYPVGSAGALLLRLNSAPGSGPVVVVPGAPANQTMGRVYGYLETASGVPAANIRISFLLKRTGAIASERLVTTAPVIITTDSQGRVSDGENPWQDLQRNDHLAPAGSYYEVTCAELNLTKKRMELNGELFDLRSLVVT